MTNKWMNRDGGRASSEMIMRNAYKQYKIQHYFIVEGESDEKFFSNIINISVCKIVNLKGKDNVVEFIKEQNKAKKKCYIGVVDADFNNITKKENAIENLFQIDVHDVEVLILSHMHNYRKIYSEYADINLVEEAQKRFGKCFVEKVMDAAYQIGVMKLTVQDDKYKNINMKELPYQDFIDEDFNVDVDVLVTRIKQRYLKSELLEDFKCSLAKNLDRWQICCGHDITSILAIAFSDKSDGGMGYGVNLHLKKERIESTLRSAYDYVKFITTKIYLEILKWQEKHNVELLILEESVSVA